MTSRKANTDVRPASDTANSRDFPGSSLAFAIGAMWTVFALSFSLFEHGTASKLADLALYVSMTVATPIAGYVGLRTSQRFAPRSAHVLWFVTVTFLIITISTFFPSPSALLSLVAIYLGIASVLLFLAARNGVVLERTFSQWSWIPTLAAIAAAASFLRLALDNIRPYFYWPNQDSSLGRVGVDVTRYGPDISRVQLATGLALAIILLIKLSRTQFKTVGRQSESGAARLPLWILSGALIGYLLVCPLPTYDTGHYGAYIGPLLLLRHGGWPLVDVFSQYGLSFLAYLPLGSLLPFNYAAAALVSNLVNIAMLLVALAIIYALVGHCRLALPVSAILIVVIWLSFPYNATSTPSVFGVRWLPTWMLCWLLVRDTPPRQAGARLWALLLLNLAALWSFETHLVAVVVFGLHAALVSRLEANSLWRAIAQAIAAVPLSLIGHGLLISATLIWRGRLPSYGTYFEFMQFYLADGDPDIAYDWQLLAKSTIVSNIWLLFAAAYAALICLAFSSFMLGRSLFMPPRLLIGFATVAMTGVAQSVYVVGRPTLPLLAFSALPLYTLSICALLLFLDFVVDRRGMKYQLAFCGGALLIAFPAGYAWDRIQMPYNGGFLFGSNNASLLVRCIQFSMCNPVHELRLIATAIAQDSPSPIDHPPDRRQIDDLVMLYKKWQDTTPNIGMIAPKRTPALVKLGVEDALRANNFANDFMSSTLRKRLSISLEQMPAGSLIMTTTPTGPFEIGLLCGLLTQYRLEQVDSTGDVSVDRLMPLDYDFQIGSPVAQIDNEVLLPFKHGSNVPVQRAPAGLPAGVVEQLLVRRQTAVVSGWTSGRTTSEAPKTIVITMHNRIWGLARPGTARPGTAGSDPNIPKSRFQLYACNVDQADTADFRAYVWSGSGSATELEYSPGVRPAGLR